MRAFTIILICLFLSLPSLAQDTKSFDEMTYQELQAVDAGTLSKADKKLYKKALRTAQKAEKKRIAAEKKAEKKRIAAEKKAARAREKAEAKRLRAETKAREKHNKRIYKQIELVSDVYTGTKILRDEFEAFIEVVGPRYPRDHAWLLARDPIDFHFRAFFYPASQELLLRLVTSRELVFPEITPENVDSFRGGPERYLSRQGYWHYYSRATLRGGIELEVEPLEKYLYACNSIQCEFREDLGITLTMDVLLHPLEKQEALRIKVSGVKGHEYFIGLSPGIIIGFLKKLSETGALNEETQKAINTAEVTLHNRIQANPTASFSP